MNTYNFPTDAFTKIEYTGLGVPGRNFPLVKEADAIIIINGQIGSLNEFTIAFNDAKIIGILENSGGITDIIDKIAEICDKKGEKENIVYSSEPKELVTLVLNKLK
jgi:predicted Rossmann-fold nucleotide-binding protein